MNLRDVASTLVQVPALLKAKKMLKPRPPEDADCIARLLETTAARVGQRVALVFEGQEVTWSELEALTNQLARALKDQGVGRGDCVTLMMENRVEFVALFCAVNKLGAVSALVNTNLRDEQLEHCITMTDSKKCVFGAELAEAIEGVKGNLPLASSDFLGVADGTLAAPEWGLDLGNLASNQATGKLPDTDAVLLGDTAVYIFTSGTTGMPKAAVMSNRRFLAGALSSHQAGLKASENDRLYLCLPLYHGTGLVLGAGAAFSSGASMFIRRRFSASAFLPEIREHKVNLLVYIGELCRYLTNTAEQPDDASNPLQRMIGNGMRPDVWMKFKNRFGVKRIVEFYAASEGNVSFANMLNKDCTIGMTTTKIALVRYDVDTDEIVRTADGRCQEVEPGEAGLLLGHIDQTAVFEGYTDKSATESKILRDVLEAGDAWFNTGDLIKEVDAGYTLGYPHYQFVDRVGDTFRWKSENVSTNEVGEIINHHPDVKYSNVYGVLVPGTDGRAGMAAITLADGVDALDYAGFSKYVNEHLPAYARPVFIRVQRELEVTGTFKLVKGELRKQGFDPALSEDPVHVMKPGTTEYVAMDADYFRAISEQTAGF